METTKKNLTSEDTKLNVLIEFKMDRAQSAEISPIQYATKLANALEIDFDKTYTPVPVNPTGEHKRLMAMTQEDNVQFLMRASIHKKHKKQIKKHEAVLEVWTDAIVASSGVISPHTPTPGYCPLPENSEGDLSEVARNLSMNYLYRPGTGRGILVGVVDAGITSNTLSLVDGLRPPRGTISNVRSDVGWTPDDIEPGRWAAGNYHGNMMAKDIQLLAPDTEFMDLRIVERRPLLALLSPDLEGGWYALISNAIQAYNYVKELPASSRPKILVNGWNVYSPDDARDYATNLDHPFNRIVNEMVITYGIVVLFGAGNCGHNCPDGRCAHYSVPGRSIWGAAALPSVITVGAVDANLFYLGYSSQGPATVSWWDDTGMMEGTIQKPDICSISHFPGYTHCDAGTSVATATAAAVVSALLEIFPNALPVNVKRALISSAIEHRRDPAGWNSEYGFGSPCAVHARWELYRLESLRRR